MDSSYRFFLSLTGEKCGSRVTQTTQSAMKPILRQLAIVFAVIFSISSSRAGILDKLGSMVTNATAGGTNSGGMSAAVSSLSQDQVVGGLKQALSNGLQHAVGSLGHQDGFMTNLNVKIPMPE